MFQIIVLKQTMYGWLLTVVRFKLRQLQPVFNLQDNFCIKICRTSGFEPGAIGAQLASGQAKLYRLSFTILNRYIKA